MTVEGQDRLKAIKGPVIFVANHLSNLDGIVLTNLLKEDFDPYFIAGIKLSNEAFTNFFKALVKTINIKPNTADLDSVKTMVNAVKAGESIMIFPEGTRSRTGHLNEPKKGILLIARLTGVPLVPIGIMGTEKVLPIDPGGDMSKERIRPGRVQLTVGEPFYIPKKEAGEGKAEYEKRALDTLMNAIANLIHEPYRGGYGHDSEE